MDTSKRKALRAAGWKIGDASDFLEMSAAERQELDARLKLALRGKPSRKIERQKPSLKKKTP